MAGTIVKRKAGRELRDGLKSFLILILGAAGCIVIIIAAILLTKWIWDSDLPTWAKVMLSK